MTPPPTAPKIIVIIQARMGSTRLPGKILKPLAGVPVLSHVITRAGAPVGVDRVVVAVPKEAASAPALACAKQAGAFPFEGSEHDVLDRYFRAYQAEAEDSGRAADYIIRITADCPLIAPDVIDAMIKGTLESGADYGGVNHFPHGLDCEIFSAALLKRCHTEAKSPEDREHVTLWMKRQKQHPPFILKAEGHFHADHRWVVDYPEDYAFFQALEASELGPTYLDMPWRQLADWLATHEEIRRINAAVAKEWATATNAIIKAAEEER